MIDIKLWMDRFIYLLKETFGERIYFVGLQGSYGRDEATEASDIDAVVILNKLTVDKGMWKSFHCFSHYVVKYKIIVVSPRRNVSIIQFEYFFD